MPKFSRHRDRQSPAGVIAAAHRPLSWQKAQLLECPTVVLHSELYTRLHAYVRAVPGEITLYAASSLDLGRNEIRVAGHLFLPQQRASASRTEVTEEGMAQMLVEAVRLGLDTTRLNVWIHSHGSMGVFFSAEDETSIAEAFTQAEMVLCLVVNKAMEIKARLSLARPVSLQVDDLPVAIGLAEAEEAAVREEVRQKVCPGYIYPAHERRWDPQPSSNGCDAPLSPAPYATYGGYRA